ncbi:MAG: ORF6N domain-containing protein [Bacteroidales bacterium]|nr:ORF6N domain-containing protein [Bacteroidales bacterium]
MDKNNELAIPDEIIKDKIYFIRGQKVMIDRDLAELYGVETRVLKQSVRRHIKRFPEDFMFQMTKEEFENLRSQFVMSRQHGGTRYLPMVFTEQGVAMLSSVLNSDRAIMVNIQIIRTFTKIRQMLSSHKEILLKLEQIESKNLEYDEKFMLIFEYLKQLEETKQTEAEQKNRKNIGF